MSRTTKDILIKGVGLDKAKEAVVQWFQENKIKILVNTPDCVYGQLGIGVLSAPKYFEINLEQAEDGVWAKTEGWVAYVPPSFLSNPKAYIPETEFSESARTYGGIPRKQGMKAIKRLWITLEALSRNP